MSNSIDSNYFTPFDVTPYGAFDEKRVTAKVGITPHFGVQAKLAVVEAVLRSITSDELYMFFPKAKKGEEGDDSSPASPDEEDASAGPIVPTIAAIEEALMYAGDNLSDHKKSAFSGRDKWASVCDAIAEVPRDRVSSMELFGVPFNLGLIPLVGGAKTGKTTLLHKIALQRGSTVYTVNEPYVSGSSSGPVTWLQSYSALIAAAVRDRYLDVVAAKLTGREVAPTLVLADSFREFIWTVSGGLGSRGLPNLLGAALTYMSNALAPLGILILGAFNPSYRDPEFVARFDDVVTESCPSFLRLEGWVENEPSLFYEQRPSRIPSRVAKRETQRVPDPIEAHAARQTGAGRDGITITFDQQV